MSIQLAIPSLSVSSGFEEASRGSVSQVISSWSLKPSLSSSVSALLPMPSLSVSNHSVASSGKAVVVAVVVVVVVVYVVVA